MLSTEKMRVQFCNCTLFVLSTTEMSMETQSIFAILIWKIKTSIASDGLCASEVDHTLIHYDVTFTKEVAAMVHIISIFQYHIIRLQTTQTTSGPRGTITK